jgi:hypothetical protein
MTALVLLLVAIATAASAPASTSAPLPERGKALLFGAYTPWTTDDTGQTTWIRVTFVKLDDVASPSGSKLSIEPGHHVLDVRCDVSSPRPVQVLWGAAVVDVEADLAYDVVGSLNHSDRYCDVGLVKRS